MTVELVSGLLISFLGLVVAFQGYQLNRQKRQSDQEKEVKEDAKNDVKESTEIKTQLGYISKGVDDIRIDLKANEKQMIALFYFYIKEGAIYMKITGSAGHELRTPGKRTPDDSMREFMFNVAVFNYFKQEMEKYIDSKGKKVSVIGVQDPTGNKGIPLTTRSNNVNKHKPDLHIDFHANAHGSGLKWTDGNGLETYVYKKTLKDAVKVANAVQNSIVKATGLKNRGVKEGNLHMIRETNPTSILVEGPFMSNRKEAELLKSDTFRGKFALAIVDGVAEAYNLKRNSTKAEENDGKLRRLYTGTFATEASAKDFKSDVEKAFDVTLQLRKEGDRYRLYSGTFSSKTGAENFKEEVENKFDVTLQMREE